MHAYNVFTFPVSLIIKDLDYSSGIDCVVYDKFFDDIPKGIPADTDFMTLNIRSEQYPYEVNHFGINEDMSGYPIKTPNVKIIGNGAY